MYGAGVDWMFWSFIAAGAGVLALAARQRAAATAARSTRLGMTARPDLTEVPSELQRTALWTLTEGGTERGVVGGVLSLAAHDVEITCFDLAEHRRLRLEWAWLDVATPFRLHTPLTIVACRIPRQLPHLLIKRAGPADTIAPRDVEQAPRAAVGAPAMVDAIALGAAAHAARALTEVKDMAEAPPTSLGRAALTLSLPRMARVGAARPVRGRSPARRRAGRRWRARARPRARDRDARPADRGLRRVGWAARGCAAR